MPLKEFDLSKPQKLSPITLLLILGKITKQGFPFILVMVGSKFLRNQKAGDAESLQLFYYLLGLYGVFVLVHLKQFIQYFRYRFFIQGNELIVLSGVFSREKTLIPLNRIQSVHLVQNYVHRFTNTCGLKLETAGSTQTEFEAKAIDRDLALYLEDILQQKDLGETIDRPIENPILIGLNLWDLFKLAITENHLKTFVIIFAFIVGKIDDLNRYLGYDLEGAIESQYDKVKLGYVLIVELILILTFITLIFSVVRIVIRYHAMRLTKTDKGFSMEWGFLQTQQKMLRLDKLQQVNWNQNFLRRLLHVNIIRFYMAGEDLTKESAQIQLPAMQPKIVEALLQCYQASLPSSRSSAQMVHHSYAWRITLIFLLPLFAAITVALFFWKEYVAILPIVLFLYIAIERMILQRKFRFWYTDEALQIQKGVWGRKNILVRWNNVQHVVLKTSPYLRSKQLSTLVIYTSGEKIQVPYIPTAQAQYIADLCLVVLENKLNAPVTSE